MLRIAVYDPEQAKTAAWFDAAVAILRAASVKCELTALKNLKKAEENFAADKQYYDILILSAEDPACLALANRMRRKNAVFSLIFTAGEAVSVKPLLRFRPSALITGGAEDTAFGDALRFCCAEQMRYLSHFTVKNKGSLLRIPFEEIRFFESRQRLVILHGTHRTVEFYAKLSEVQEKLPQDIFLRCHQSFLVNMQAVSRLDRSNRCFVLNSGATIEISKANYTQAAARYEAFLENR